MKVAVTGSQGFIGRTLVHMLEQKPRTEVMRIDTAHHISVLDPNALDVCLTECEVVYHLAGILGTDELFDYAHDAIDVNIKGTLNVLEACRNHEVAFVGITMPDVWRNVYQATKMASRRIAEAWHDTYGVPVSHVRAFNVFGHYQKVRGVRKIIPTFASSAWRGKPIEIWGDGSQSVDLVHVDQVASVLIEASDLSGCQVVDAGTTRKFTVLEVADMVRERCGSKTDHVFLPMRRGETPTQIVATGEGWEYLTQPPRFDQKTLNDTIDWYKLERP